MTAPPGARAPPDPRSALNAHGLTPAELAAQGGAAALAAVLLPGMPVAHVVDVHELIR